jgi:diguanylate cyclase (GGDEF)-like protein
MKIKSYLATVILTCLIGGYLIESVLSRQFNSVQAATDQHSHSISWQKDYERIVQDMSQFLITTDLVLGSDATYLARGAVAKGRVIAQSLEELSKQPAPVELGNELTDAATTVTTISQYIQQGSTQSGNNRAQALYDLLLKSDAISEEMIAALNAVRLSVEKAVTLEAKNLANQKDYTGLLQTICRVGFVLLIFALWLWTNRQISNPLRRLSQIAKEAEHGKPFTGVSRGPKEVIELSDNTQRLTHSLSYQATHDALTDLYNRREFERLLPLYLNKPAEHDQTAFGVLCFIDLDYFKVVNDTCGHTAGDELLEQVARLLQEKVRTTDVVARLGGDEFAILLVACDLETGMEIANKVRNSIMELRYHWEGKVFRISASIGLTEITDQGAAIDNILNAADTACKVAKDSGRDRVHVFGIQDKAMARKRHEMLWLNQLNSAIDENRFVLHRQYITPLQTGLNKKSRFEVLLRLKTLEGKLIYPDHFLPLAERYQLCARLDRWAIETTIDWLSENKSELDKLDICSINLSGQTIASQDMYDFIEEKIRLTAFPAEKLCFEITESAALSNLDNAKSFISDLKHLGCQFALDDFGSGSSSFSHLKSLDVDTIKIDSSFIKDLFKDPVNLATVKSINEVAKTLNKTTIAEGVETEAVAKELTSLGIDFAQGFHFGEPQALSSEEESTTQDDALVANT